MPVMNGGLDQIDAFMAAIRQIESGGSYTAQSPYNPGYGHATGAYQFLDSTWGGYGGYTRAMDAPPAVQDERARQLMTNYFNQFGSWDLVAVAWHAGPGSAQRVQSGQATPGDFADINISTQQYLERVGGAFGQSGGSTGGGGATTAAGGGEQQARRGNDRYPPDGTLFRDGSTYVLRFRLGRGVQIEYEVTDMDALRRSGYNTDQARDYRDPRNENVQLINYQTAGDASEIGDILEQGYGTMEEFFDDVIYSQFSPFDPAIRNPEIRRIIAEAMANPELLQSEGWLQAQVQQTTWWAERNDLQREYNSLSPGEQEQRNMQQADLLRQAFFQETGRQISLADPRLMRWARRVASGKMTFGQVTQRIRDIAQRDPESPYSRTLRSEEQNRNEFSVNVENAQEQVRGLAQQWGVELSPATISQWAEDLEMGRRSEADLTQYFRNQARVLYPWMDTESGLTTREAAEPWLQTYGRLMERSDASLFNPDIQAALSAGMSIPEFEQQLRQRPEWLSTSNARDTIGSLMGEVSRTMGFN